MTWESIVPLSAFLAMALSVWVGLTAAAEKQARASDRLDRLIKGTGRRAGPSPLMRRQDRIQELVARAAPALSKPLKPKNEADLGKLRMALLNTGFRGEQAVQV